MCTVIQKFGSSMIFFNEKKKLIVFNVEALNW